MRCGGTPLRTDIGRKWPSFSLSHFLFLLAARANGKRNTLATVAIRLMAAGFNSRKAMRKVAPPIDRFARAKKKGGGSVSLGGDN
jgi:hypothetical protein